MGLKFSFLFSLLIVSTTARALSPSVNVSFEYPVEIASPTAQGLGKFELVQPNTDIPLYPEKMVWIQSKGKVPVLIIPALPVNADTAKIQLPDAATWPPPAVAEEVETKVSAMVEGITAFQIAIRKKNLSEADVILNRLQATQNIAYLSFLRATLDFVKGDLASARVQVKKGLQRYPANEQGLNLLKNLGEEPTQ
jgi:hypothetical protein